jgi:ribose 5-phosphate isomerase B
MGIAVGSDHAGDHLQEFPAARLATSGHEVEDLGTHCQAPVDHREFGAAVDRAVSRGRHDRRIREIAVLEAR